MTSDPLPWPPYIPLPESRRQTGVLRRLGNPLDWLAVVAAATAFGCSFVTFYTTRVTLSAVPLGLPTGPETLKQWTARSDAWHGIFGWLAVALALTAAVLLIAAAARGHLWLLIAAAGTAAAATVFIAVAALITPSMRVEDDGRAALRQARGFGLHVGLTIDHSRGTGFWIALAAIVLALLFTLLRVRQRA
jgi:hypothetical protein